LLTQHFRIAPTPSGFLHLGNAFNFILTATLARSKGGSLRLRIDDGDAARARPEYIEDIFETLHWLGIRWDEGPRDAADHGARFSQRHRIPRYNSIINALIGTGRVFACTCSRKGVLATSADGQYPGTCRHKAISLDTPNTALRIQTPADAKIWMNDALAARRSYGPHAYARDPIIRRRDGLPAYHVASLADDLDHGITQIIRGADLLASTVAQLYLSQLLSTTAFDDVVCLHHPLITDSEGHKLSKSAGSASLNSQREAGIPATEIYAQFARFMEWPEDVRSFEDAVRVFSHRGLRAWKNTPNTR